MLAKAMSDAHITERDAKKWTAEILDAEERKIAKAQRREVREQEREMNGLAMLVGRAENVAVPAEANTHRLFRTTYEAVSEHKSELIQELLKMHVRSREIDEPIGLRNISLNPKSVKITVQAFEGWQEILQPLQDKDARLNAKEAGGNLEIRYEGSPFAFTKLLADENPKILNRAMRNIEQEEREYQASLRRAQGEEWQAQAGDRREASIRERRQARQQGEGDESRPQAKPDSAPESYTMRMSRLAVQDGPSLSFGDDDGEGVEKGSGRRGGNPLSGEDPRTPGRQGRTTHRPSSGRH